MNASIFYGMLPVIIAIGEGFGVAALPIAVAMVVCRNCATFISPMVPATLLGTGLADVDIKDHIKSSFLWVWGFSVACMIFAIVLGVMPLSLYPLNALPGGTLSPPGKFKK